ncbi:MAG: hypothetical protein IKJ35_08320 [Clostridia bacterium]|nr:hypothetical protein [Clostridia bacterium]
MKIVDINHLIDGGKAIYDHMTATQYSVDRSWEHCHGAFLKIKQKYHNPKTEMTPEERDFLCLSLGWYLASWGMLRNSFLNEYSHEIHRDAIRVIYDHRWDALWDIDYAALTSNQAELIQTLAKELEDTYKGIHHFERDDYRLTDTLKTKILLGTVACVPAYDRFFVCALRHSLKKANFCAESLLELKKVYIAFETHFDSMKTYCSRGNYPSAKLLDMCFFEYGVKLSNIEEKSKKIMKSHIPDFNSRNKAGRDITNFVCLYVMHGNGVKSIESLSRIYHTNATIYDSIRQEVLLKL